MWKNYQTSVQWRRVEGEALKDDKRLQKKYALSNRGARDLIKAALACVLQNISFMFPVGLLYALVSDLMGDGVPQARKDGILYCQAASCVLGLILLTTWFQYNATYFATYTESGVRRITLAEQLRKAPFPSLGKRTWPI